MSVRSTTAARPTSSASKGPSLPAASPALPPNPATLKVVVYPDPVLKKHAREVTQFDPWLKSAVEKMKDLMEQEEGVGLAAPQVGLSLRFFVWSPTGKATDARALVNPVFTAAEDTQEEGEEGCLSLPDIRTKVMRYKRIRVEAVDEFGAPISLELADYPARIVQHETDHLDGTLILDRMSPLAKIANRKKIKELESNKTSAKK